MSWSSFIAEDDFKPLVYDAGGGGTIAGYSQSVDTSNNYNGSSSAISCVGSNTGSFVLFVRKEVGDTGSETRKNLAIMNYAKVLAATNKTFMQFYRWQPGDPLHTTVADLDTDDFTGGNGYWAIANPYNQYGYMYRGSMTTGATKIWPIGGATIPISSYTTRTALFKQKVFDDDNGDVAIEWWSGNNVSVSVDSDTNWTRTQTILDNSGSKITDAGFCGFGIFVDAGISAQMILDAYQDIALAE